VFTGDLPVLHSSHLLLFMLAEETEMTVTVPKTDRTPSLTSNINTFAITQVSAELNILLADVFALYIKTKNFHWHMSGPHFRDFHLMLDEHADQLFGMTDEIAERVRKLGCTTLRSIGQIAQLQTIADNDADHLAPADMLKELHADEMLLAIRMHAAHTLCDDAGDVATASLLENWIDQSQRRAWFLRECTHAH